MDQPTVIEMTIKGKAEDVKHAALVAQRRIDLETRGFKEAAYMYGDGSDFESKLNKAIVFGHFSYSEKEDGTAEFSSEQDSYGCLEKKDIVDIAVAATPG